MWKTRVQVAFSLNACLNEFLSVAQVLQDKYIELTGV